VRQHLVIARVGRRSLHRFWVDPAKERSWDLYLCPFQEVEAASDVECTIGDVLPGPKWEGIRALLNSWNGWRDYEYIWLPDDDIFSNQDDINAVFRCGAALNFDLFAPALHENSYYAHYITMANQSFFARRVGFVEIMVPCFRRETLERLLPTLELSTTGWGWGLDSVWPKLLGYEGLGILDGVSVLHTRPVGSFRDQELGRRVMEESDRLLQRYGCRQEMTTFAGIDEALVDVPLSPDQLLVRLIEGWHYLLDRDPAILRWTVEHQRGSFEWKQYGTEGAPSGPFRNVPASASDGVHKTVPLNFGPSRTGGEPVAGMDEPGRYPNAYCA
jgi:hypothetical protein